MKEKLKFIDLFAGCGGLSLGMEQAGFYPLYVNELNKDRLNIVATICACCQTSFWFKNLIMDRLCSTLVIINTCDAGGFNSEIGHLFDKDF